MEKNHELRGVVYLLIAAFIWGSAFVAQSVGMDHVGPFTFQFSRSALATLFLIPVFRVMDCKKRSADPDYTPVPCKKTLWTAGIVCGILMTVAANLQQTAIQYTTAAKAGFISSFYIVVVPLLGLFLKKRVSGRTWLCVVLALVGLYLLSITDGFSSVSKGDVYLFLCSLAFGCHILVVDYFSPKVDGIRLSCIQFFICALLTSVLMLAFESPDWQSIRNAAVPIAYAGILSSGVAYTLQIVAQKYTHPSVASLVMSLEAVFAVLAGAVMLREIPTAREAAGCSFMFVAIVISQLPERRRKRPADTPDADHA